MDLLLFYLPLFVTLLGNLLLLAACILLFRKRRLSSWLMLAGVVIRVLDTLQICYFLNLWFFHTAGQGYLIASALWRLTGDGLLLIGFILHVLEHRALLHRVSQWEMIVEEQAKPQGA